MSSAESHKPRPPLDDQLVAAFLKEIRDVPVGARLHVQPSADLCYVLEYYVPKLLRERYPEWHDESLDGFFFDHGEKTGPLSARLAGMTILISDQTVTPIHLEISLAPAADAVERVRLKLGEPGGGALGISGPVCNSRDATRLIATFGDRLYRIRWSYRLDIIPGKQRSP